MKTALQTYIPKNKSSKHGLTCGACGERETFNRANFNLRVIPTARWGNLCIGCWEEAKAAESND